MFKKIITFLLLFIFINSNFFCIFANTNPLVWEKLYYYDTDYRKYEVKIKNLGN